MTLLISSGSRTAYQAHREHIQKPSALNQKEPGRHEQEKASDEYKFGIEDPES